MKNFFKNKYLWWSLFVLLVIVLFWLYKANKYDFIRQKVTGVIAEKTDSLYKIHYDSIMVDEAEGNVFLYNLHVWGDTILQNKYIAAGDTMAAPLLLDIIVPQLMVTGFNTMDALMDKQLICDKIVIQDPRITITTYAGRRSSKDISEQGQDLYKKILGDFEVIKTDSVAVMNAEVVVQNNATQQIAFHTFNSSVFLKDVLVDSAHYNDTTRTLFSKKLTVHTDKVTTGTNAKGLDMTDLTFDTEKKVLAIAEIKNNASSGGAATKLRRLFVTGLSAKGPADNIDLTIGDADIGDANITIPSGKKDKGASKTPPMLGEMMHSLKLVKLTTRNLELNMAAASGEKDDFTVKAKTLQITNVMVDSTTQLDASFLQHASGLEITNRELSFKSKDGMYNFVCTGLHATPAKQSLRLQQFSLVPTLGEVAFAKKARTQQDRYDIRVNNIVASGLDFEKLAKGEIDIKTVTASARANIYRDISHPLDSVSKVGSYPHQLLMKLKTPVNIDKIKFSDTYISYKEKNPISDTSGTLKFDKGTITLSNITNHPAGNNIMTMNTHLYLLGKVPLSVNIKFYLDKADQGQFYVKGTGNTGFDGTLLNQVTIPMGVMRVDKGQIDKLNFQFMANNLDAQGTLTAEYRNLKISLMKRDKGKPSSFDKKGITSFLANIIVKNNNPSNGKLRTADVVYHRDIYKSFFNMIWKFVFNGLKDEMGAKL